MNIQITDHVCNRYIERFNPGLAAITNNNTRIKTVKQAIIAILKDATYVSDNKDGVLLFSQNFNCNLIIRDKTLITIYPPDKKTKFRENKHARNSSNSGFNQKRFNRNVR